MTIGFLGPQGTHTQRACMEIFPQTQDLSSDSPPPNIQMTPCVHIEDVFAGVAHGSFERGVVPIENLIHGPVTETLDALYAFGEKVIVHNTHMLRIQHALGAMCAASEIQEIWSKDQALKQCSQYLRQHHPHAKLVPMSSTAAAVQQLISLDTAGPKPPNIAVIAAPQTLQEAGLNLHARDMGDVANNTTRFAVLAPAHTSPLPFPQANATALIIDPHRDQVGLLYTLLETLSQTHKLNCNALHARPDKRGILRFFVEVDGHIQQERMQHCLRDLRHRFAGTETKIHVCGSYPSRSFAQAEIGPVLIIGGHGKMGQWLQNLFARDHIPTHPWESPKDGELQTLIPACKTILFSVPLGDAPKIIQEIAPQALPGQLLVDNSSLKSAAMQALQTHAPKGVETLGIHTMFGPKTQHLSKNNVLWIPTESSGAKAQALQDLFYKFGAQISLCSPQEHDKQMAVHQNLEHVHALAMAKLLATNPPPQGQQQDNFCTPNSKATLSTVQRILGQDPHLLAEIQRNNPHALPVLKRYVENIQFWIGEIERAQDKGQEPPQDLVAAIQACTAC